MRSMNSPLSASHQDIDSIKKFVTAYANAIPSEKESLFTYLKLTWMPSINAIQFGLLISCIEYTRIFEYYHAATIANPLFLKDAEEFTQICAYLNPERITLFCRLIEQRLHTPGFIDNPTAFSAIFSVFFISMPDGEKRQIQLDKQQLLTVYNILKPKLNTRNFFRTLDDFINLFLLIPTTENKVTLFEIIQGQLIELVKTKNNVAHIHEKLKPSNPVESELFKQTRERIFRAIISDQTRLDKAFHAMLFLILDHYPGNQPAKLKSIIDTTFSDPSITELNALLEKTENAMRFVEFNITSTRLQNALTHLIANLRTEERRISVDHIIQLAKSKEPIMAIPFFKEPAGIEIHTTAKPGAFPHEF